MTPKPQYDPERGRGPRDAGGRFRKVVGEVIETAGDAAKDAGDAIENLTDRIAESLGATPIDPVPPTGGSPPPPGVPPGGGPPGGDPPGGPPGGGTPPPPSQPPSPPHGGPSMPPELPIQFRDIAEREAAAVVAETSDAGRKKIQAFDIIGAAAEGGGGGGGTLLNPGITTTPLPTLRDPFFKGVVAALDRMGFDPVEHVNGFFPTQQGDLRPLDENELAVAAVFGILEADNQVRPERAGWHRAATLALDEYTRSIDLFQAVLPHLAREGRTSTALVVRADQWAEVVRLLRGDGVRFEDPQLGILVRSALANQVVPSDNALPSSIDIDLPDLEEQADLEIVADNVRAVQALHFAAMLEELKLFQVVDKLVELFQNGLLPFGRGRAGDLLFRYWKNSIDRLGEVERRNIYARTFAMPGGDPSLSGVNREFADLFMRFVSAVSEFVRQFRVDDLLRATTPLRVSDEAVRKSGRDLAANLSLYGYGIAHFAATELQTQLNDIIAILSDPEVKNSYGARDMFQVVDQVATLELGGAKNSIRYRTMATSGAIIIRWLAERADLLAKGFGPVLDPDAIRVPPPRLPGQKPTTHPTDRDLVDACEQWLAITGTPESRVEEYAQPVEGPNLTSRPIALPQVAKDLLDQVGVSAGYGYGREGNNGPYSGRFHNR